MTKWSAEKNKPSIAERVINHSREVGARLVPSAVGMIFGLGKRSSLAIVAILLLAASVGPSGQTLAPSPVFTGFDSDGDPISSGKLCTYLAGSSTPATTYSDYLLASSNTNPVILSSAGRATVFLTTGISYKFVLLTPGSDTTCSTGSTVWTVDGVGSVPTSSNNTDVLGTAGEAITAGQAVYLSDGSGSKTAGAWYKADATLSYASTTGIVGMAPSAISSLAVGTIRLAGQVTGLTSLTVGSTYFVSATTPGSITLTSPSNHIRRIGTADSTSTLILNAAPYVPPYTIGACNGRLTLTTGVPVTRADVTAATTVRFAPIDGNRCAVYDGSWWTVRTFSELSIAVPATTASIYDVFLYDNAGTLALELSTLWSSDLAIFSSGTYTTTRPTQDGVFVKSTNGTTIDNTRRYLGTFRTTAVSGQTEDSLAKRYVWNNYNRRARPMRVTEATDTWTYTLATLRQANASSANQLDCVVGIADMPIRVSVNAYASNSGGNVRVVVGIGEDTTTTGVSGSLYGIMNAASANQEQVGASYIGYLSIGRHFYPWLEYSVASGTTTWYGDAGTPTITQAGIMGEIEG